MLLLRWQLAEWEAKQAETSQRLASSSSLALDFCSEEEAAAALQALEERLRAQGLTDQEVQLQLTPQVQCSL